MIGLVPGINFDPETGEIFDETLLEDWDAELKWSMFTFADFNRVNRKYFKIQALTAFHIILKSRNTGHYWDLSSQEFMPGQSSIIIGHKHREDDRFHIQRKFHAQTVDEAQELIKKHDLWHLKVRKTAPVQKRRKKHTRMY